MEEETWVTSSFSDDYEVSHLGSVRQKNTEVVLKDVRINECLLDAFLKRPEIERMKVDKKAAKPKKPKNNQVNERKGNTPVDVTVRGEAPEKFDSLEEAAEHLGIPVASMYRNNDKGFVNGISIVSRDSSEIGPRPKPKSIKLEVTVRGKEPLRFDSPKEAAAHLRKSVATIYKNIGKGFVDRISVAKAGGVKRRTVQVKEESIKAEAFVGLIKKRRHS